MPGSGAVPGNTGGLLGDGPGQSGAAGVPHRAAGKVQQAPRRASRDPLTQSAPKDILTTMRKGLVVGGALVALLACAAPARAGNATVTITQTSTFRVPTGVTSLDVVAIGQHGGGATGGQGARVAGTLSATPGSVFSVLVASGGGAGATPGGGLSGLLQAGTPQLIAAGGGGAAGTAGGDAGAAATGASGGGAGTLTAGGKGGG